MKVCFRGSFLSLMSMDHFFFYPKNWVGHVLFCKNMRVGPGGGGVTPLFGLYGDVLLDRVWFLASLS